MGKKCVLILGTGGTIAGKALIAGDNVGYKAGEVPVEDLVAPLRVVAPWLSEWQWRSQQVAQLDSKDMDAVTWLGLATAITKGLDDPEVAAVVVTHGTDTLEETAFFLSQVVPHGKPVVLTCAMRPASALTPDGPQNLLDALAVATDAHAKGVCVVAAGTVHSAHDVSKVHTYRVDAFSSGDTGPLGCVEEGRVRWYRQNTPCQKLALSGGSFLRSGTDVCLHDVAANWPRVELVTSHACATGSIVDALLQPFAEVAPLAGLVVAGTGNGTVHVSLLDALQRARSQGIVVWRTTRCPFGQVVPGPALAWPDAVPLSPVKARIALALALCSQK